MKAISLWQPWATALFLEIEDLGKMVPLKADETRHWALPANLIGERVAIHAALKWDGAGQIRWVQHRLGLPPEATAPMTVDNQKRFVIADAVKEFNALPRGCIIGTLRFVACRRTDGLIRPTPQSWWGNYASGRFAWETADRELFAQPVPCKGRQGVFNWEPTT